MPTRSADPAEVLRTVLHELRSRVGAIRLAISTVKDGAADPDLQASLLGTADRETLRVSDELAAVIALVRCVTSRSRPETVDVARALRDAGSVARRMGVRVRVRAGRQVRARARPGALASALPALLQLVADADGEAVASTARDGALVLVRVRRPDARPIAAGSALVRHLLDETGATPVPAEEGIAFSFPGVRS
jgi:hypothetical protein